MTTNTDQLLAKLFDEIKRNQVELDKAFEQVNGIRIRELSGRHAGLQTAVELIYELNGLRKKVEKV